MCQDGGQPVGHSHTDLYLQIWSHYSKKNLQHFFEVAWCFPGDSEGKESACNTGDQGLIPGSGRSPGGGNSNPLQYSCLENSMDRGAWRATVLGVAKSQT